MTRRKCPTGKRRYRDSIAAAYALGSIEQARWRKPEHVECRSYECGLCGGFHLTSQPKWESHQRPEERKPA